MQTTKHKAVKLEDSNAPKRKWGINDLFYYDDSLLCGLVCDNVECVMAPDDTVLHLSIAPNIWIISLDASNGASDLGRLHGGHPEGI